MKTPDPLKMAIAVKVSERLDTWLTWNVQEVEKVPGDAPRALLFMVLGLVCKRLHIQGVSKKHIIEIIQNTP
jgi:hypothetical protein